MEIKNLMNTIKSAFKKGVFGYKRSIPEREYNALFDFLEIEINKQIHNLQQKCKKANRELLYSIGDYLQSASCIYEHKNKDVLKENLKLVAYLGQYMKSYLPDIIKNTAKTDYPDNPEIDWFITKYFTGEISHAAFVTICHNLVTGISFNEAISSIRSAFDNKISEKQMAIKIVKSTKGFRQVFDSIHTSSIQEYTGSIIRLKPLYHTHNTTDLEFLKQFFHEDHSIFFEFGNSYYYLLN